MAALSIIVLTAAAAAFLAGRQHLLLHVLQQEHYEAARLRVWLAQGSRGRPAPLEVATAVAGLLSAALAAFATTGIVLLAASLLTLVLAVVQARMTFGREQIKPLVFTPRAKRLYAAAVAPAPVVLVLVALVIGGRGGAALAGLAVVAVFPLAPSLLALALRLMAPVERRDGERWARRARERLAAVDPLVVGITGSYGKTTTKFTIAKVLEQLGPTYPTPASFNSWLGVVRAINEGLEDDHRTFVAEMGAYRIGDVAQLCELTSPTIGVLTAIGPAHLERFGSLDGTERAKGELAESLPEGGTLVTRADDERCRRVAETRTKADVILFSPAPHEGSHIWAEDIRLVDGRTEFEVRTRGLGDDAPFTVSAALLGEHNVANLLAAAAVGLAAGLERGPIAEALGRVEAPPHRLSPIVNDAAGIVVIDDSYNANPTGAAAALQVLAQHPAERRILVTPGLVELGDESIAANQELGVQAAQVCDLCLLSGPHAADIERGLLSAGFDPDHVIVEESGPAAHQRLASLTRRGDVVLFENDLPDVYV